MTRSTTKSVASKGRYEIDVATSYRLDFTVSVLRRLSTNIVDQLTADGQYVRALGGFRDPILAHVVQERSDAIAVTFEGCDCDPSDHPRAFAVVCRMLGVERDLSRFDRSDARILLLQPLAARMRGVKPPRLLCGLGRLDVFPTNDSSVVRNLAFVAGFAPIDIARVLTALGPQRGMFYYHLLLARLDARTDIGRASASSASKSTS